MPAITVVSGNLDKANEIRAIAKGKYNLKVWVADIDEIQSLDLHRIVRLKAEAAYRLVKGPVIVDDVAAGIDVLNGLPGPFIKFFNKELGSDALLLLAGGRASKVTISCIMAYYDGDSYIEGVGKVVGKIVDPRGKNGFGFDPVVVPDGETRTFAEMTMQQKLRIGHRGKAFRHLLQQLDARKS